MSSSVRTLALLAATASFVFLDPALARAMPSANSGCPVVCDCGGDGVTDGDGGGDSITDGKDNAGGKGGPPYQQQFDFGIFDEPMSRMHYRSRRSVYDDDAGQANQYPGTTNTAQQYRGGSSGYPGSASSTMGLLDWWHDLGSPDRNLMAVSSGLRARLSILRQLEMMGAPLKLIRGQMAQMMSSDPMAMAAAQVLKPYNFYRQSAYMSPSMMGAAMNPYASASSPYPML